MDIGVDIIEIKRIEKTCRSKASFETRFFTSRELKGVSGKKNYYAHLAGKFAAKEAIVKALGTGFRYFKWKDIEILNNSLGKPIVIMTRKAREVFRSKGFCSVRISISHSKEYAVAFAVLLGGAKDEGSESPQNEGNR